MSAPQRRITAAASARIERELAGAPPLPPPDGLISAKQAAWLLHCTAHGTMGVLRASDLPWMLAEHGVQGGGRRARLYRREHIERIRAVRQGARISLSAAVAVVAAEVAGRI